MDRPASDYAQSGLNSPHPPLADAHSEPPAAEQASAAAAAAQYTPQQPEVRPAPQYTPQPEVRSTTISSTTPQSDYGLTQPSGRSAAYPDYLARQPQYHHAPNTQAGGAAGMAQATSPSTTHNDGQDNDHRNQSNMKSDADVPIDPSIAASSSTYPPPYSPYQPQGHDMTQYQGHPPPQMYARPEWSHGYSQHQHGLPGPYSSPATTVGSASPAATAGPRPGQVRLWFWRMVGRPCTWKFFFIGLGGLDGEGLGKISFVNLAWAYMTSLDLNCGANGWIVVFFFP
jgi:transcription factor CON7